jgi:hypothetical protein
VDTCDVAAGRLLLVRQVPGEVACFDFDASLSIKNMGLIKWTVFRLGSLSYLGLEQPRPIIRTLSNSFRDLNMYP